MTRARPALLAVAVLLVAALVAAAAAAGATAHVHGGGGGAAAAAAADKKEAAVARKMARRAEKRARRDEAHGDDGSGAPTSRAASAAAFGADESFVAHRVFASAERHDGALVDEPLVSVIVIERRQFLASAIAAVREQDYGNIEAIVVESAPRCARGRPVEPEDASMLAMWRGADASAAAAAAQAAASNATSASPSSAPAATTTTLRAPGGMHVRYHCLAHAASADAEREAAMRLAAGELVVVWQDGHWYPRGRVRAQVRQLAALDYDAVALAYSHVLDVSTLPWRVYDAAPALYGLTPQQAAVAQSAGGAALVAFSTLAFRRALWLDPTLRYVPPSRAGADGGATGGAAGATAHTNEQLDARFVRGVQRDGWARFAPLALEWLYVKQGAAWPLAAPPTAGTATATAPTAATATAATAGAAPQPLDAFGASRVRQVRTLPPELGAFVTAHVRNMLREQTAIQRHAVHIAAEHAQAHRVAAAERVLHEQRAAARDADAAARNATLELRERVAAVAADAAALERRAAHAAAMLEKQRAVDKESAAAARDVAERFDTMRERLARLAAQERELRAHVNATQAHVAAQRDVVHALARDASELAHHRRALDDAQKKQLKALLGAHAKHNES